MLFSARRLFSSLNQATIVVRTALINIRFQYLAAPSSPTNPPLTVIKIVHISVSMVFQPKRRDRIIAAAFPLLKINENDI